MTRATLKRVMAAMANPQANAAEVARQLGITTTTLYTYVNGDGTVKASGQRLLEGTTPTDLRVRNEPEEHADQRR